MLLNVIFAIVGAALVLIGADKLTDGSVALARRFAIPELVIGLTVVAFGTSLPEFVVSFFASLNGAAAMSIGNIIGSNLFNTLMIVGCTALVCPINVSRSTIYKDIPFSLLASIVLIALALDTIFGSGTNVLDRGDGIALLGFFAVFMAYTFAMATSSSSSSTDKAMEETDTAAAPQIAGWRIALYILIGLVGLIGGGELFVNGASGIARSLGVSEAMIGLTLVAGGTSLPELATSIMAARKGQSGIAVGNVIGSNLFNIFWILGACSCINPLPVQGIEWTDFSMLLLSGLMFWFFARTKHRIFRWEGAVMVAVYFAYIAFLVRGI